jgi:two-component system, NarL family, invasion response regulator UvrY
MSNPELSIEPRCFSAEVDVLQAKSLFPDSFFNTATKEVRRLDLHDKSSGTPTQTSGRNYDVVLGFPGKLDAQCMEWTLSSQGQIRQVRSFSDMDELIAYVSTDAPRVLLLDEEFASPHLQSLARQIPVRLGDCVIALFADRLSCRQLHMASPYVTGLLSRESAVKRFLSELDAVADGRRVIAESLESRVKFDLQRRFEVPSIEKIQNLTNRQFEVLILIAQGMTAKEAAHDLHITEKAVESHKYRLMRILGMRDRIELCRWAIREGLIAA